MKKLFFAISLMIVGVSSSESVSAAAGDNIFGWSWGGSQSADGAYNGIGWVSMNSTECDVNNDGTIDNATCGSGSIGSYGINIPTTDGIVGGTGYVWSEHYGWIDFRPDIHCVTGAPGAGQYQAASCTNPSSTGVGVSRSGGSLIGWARIVAIAQATVGAGNAGGYTGWVSMSSTNPTAPPSPVSYAPEITKMAKRTSLPDCNASPASCTFAWSEDLGWIEMSMSGFDATYVVCPPSLTLNDQGVGTTGQLRAYYMASGTFTCLDTSVATDVTGSVTSWTSSDNTKAIVNASGGVTAVSVGNAVIQAGVYNGKSATAIPVTVLCTSNYASLCLAQASSKCPNETISITDRCGMTTNACVGTKDCNYNWKEVAP